MALILAVLSFLLISEIASKNNIELEISSWKDYYHDIFYILSEEIVVGALLLHLLIRYAKLNSLLSTFILAFSFAIIHFVFYKWIFNDRGNMEIITLLSLFFVGLLRNNLIIITGHIGYSWALHFAWMAVMFGCYHYNTDTMNEISELHRFNTYLGSPLMLIVSIILAAGSFCLWKSRAFK